MMESALVRCRGSCVERVCYDLLSWGGKKGKEKKKRLACAGTREDCWSIDFLTHFHSHLWVRECTRISVHIVSHSFLFSSSP